MGFRELGKAKETDFRERAKALLQQLLGCALTAMGTVVFFTPNKIVSGGISGISTILLYVAQIPIGISYAIMNILLLLLGIKKLGKEFIIKTVLGTVLMSAFMELFTFMPVLTTDTMLASVCGGILYGIGLGLTFIAKGSTGGIDIVGRLIQYKYPKLSIGRLLAVLDGAIIALSVVVFRDSALALFGIVGVFVQSVAVDSLIGMFNVAQLAMIVTDKGEYVREHIRKKYDRGVTELDAHGYANEEKDKQLLVCVLNSREAADLKEELNEIDMDSFVMFAEAKTIIGKGFKYYK